MDTQDSKMEPDLTVRSQNSNDSKDSKDTKDSKISSIKSGESKNSKEVLIVEKQQIEIKDDTNLLMFMSCGQLLLGIILVVFGVLVLVHGASLGSSGAGLWAGAGALIAGALGVVATLATSTNSRAAPQNSGFATAHLASSLIALALSNMSAITALTAVVRDSQRTPELGLLETPNDEDSLLGADHGWAGILASIGLLITSIVELLISGYSCFKLVPKLCGCLTGSQPTSNQGELKTHNMVHQWVSAHPKSQPIYLVQPMMSVQPVLQTPYGIATIPKKYPSLVPATGTFPPQSLYRSMPPGYKMARGPICSPHPHYHPHMVRIKRKRYITPEHEAMSLPSHRTKHITPNSQTKVEKIETSLPNIDQVDLSLTYTGLDKKMSEEFITIAMDPDRKSKASSNNGSEISAAFKKSSEILPESKF